MNERDGDERSGGEEGIAQSLLQGEGGMNIPIFPCSLETLPLPLGEAVLVFVSSLIICMMYSAALCAVMGERGHCGRLTMRPKGTAAVTVQVVRH